MLVLVLDDREDVLLADDEELLLVDLELGAGVLRVKDLLALLDVDLLTLAVIEDPTRSDRKDRALRGLLLGSVGQDDPALGDFFARAGPDDDAVAERPKLRASGSGGGQGAYLLSTAGGGLITFGSAARVGHRGRVGAPNRVP